MATHLISVASGAEEEATGAIGCTLLILPVPLPLGVDCAHLAGSLLVNEISLVTMSVCRTRSGTTCPRQVHFLRLWCPERCWLVFSSLHQGSAWFYLTLSPLFSSWDQVRLIQW